MPTAVWSYLTVAFGGAFGAVARFGMTSFLHRSHLIIPFGTFASNLLGCFIMGAIAEMIATSTWLSNSGWFPDQYRLLFAVGFCGSFTTLSSLVFEVNDMMQRDQLFIAFSYLVGTLAGGFAFFYVGAILVRMISNAQ